MQQNIVNSSESTDITDSIGIIVEIYPIQCGISSVLQKCLPWLSHKWMQNLSKLDHSECLLSTQMYKTLQQEVATWN